ncbi:PhzF family phenazine biosynthesis protein [Nonomuraea glycinis]|uniref:Phenazine biosynthesis protein PhzF n=1 Tax=Nonomuraea glycinis TaxID=2047744 RepID=A0A918A8F5_9ACTN|nr:PhzF family phenazine biosynthesis protein [Nonomuraea glycinis]MCA2179253.1 PhzF family phenazine biosynthesis protein [Nonomuraea glycinis]GGP10070.1 phenazine biosynthesis protein PhzF [Nonomuraea glycinis]
MLRSFRQVDVFAETPYHGNPLAVVLDADGLSTEEMARFANWTNLSETTFLLPPTTPEADYRVRIFTPAGELPFAGHPTLGTCHVWREAGGVPRDPGTVVQECGAGLIRIRDEGAWWAFAAPPLLRSGPVEETFLKEVAQALGIGRDEIVDAEWADNGPGWVALLLRDAEAVLALKPRLVPADIGVVGLHPPGSPHVYEVRAFFPLGGSTAEDPVTGSLNASVAQWLLRTGRVTAPYAARQGTALGRTGQIRITAEGPDVWVGGHVITCVSGHVEI